MPPKSYEISDAHKKREPKHTYKQSATKGMFITRFMNIEIAIVYL